MSRVFANGPGDRGLILGQITLKTLAEKNLNFCLARNLIWPLESPNIFTQSGWLIQFNPNHIS